MSTEELHAEVMNKWANGQINPRTTRRDLDELEEAELVKRFEKGWGKNHRSWYWGLGRSSFDLALSPEDAMTLTAIFQHAASFGFGSNSDELNKLRDHAAGELRSRSARRLLVEGRIVTGTRFTVLQPGQHNPAHLTLIQSAMITDQSLEVLYRPRDAGEVRCSYLLKPLALAYQDSNVYLSAFVVRETWHGPEPDPALPRGKYSSNGPGSLCALMVHRMLDIKTSWEHIVEPVGYDIRSAPAQKDLMTVHAAEPIALKLRLSESLHNRLTENALAVDQRVERDGNQWQLRCRILDTQGLRLFLLSNAPHIEVIEPLHLREHIRAELVSALTHYSS